MLTTHPVLVVATDAERFARLERMLTVPAEGGDVVCVPAEGDVGAQVESGRFGAAILDDGVGLERLLGADPHLRVVCLLPASDGQKILTALRTGAATVIDREHLTGLREAVAQALRDTEMRRTRAHPRPDARPVPAAGPRDTRPLAGMWEWTSGASQVSWSPACARVVGAQDLAGPLEVLLDHFQPEDAERVRQGFARCLAEGETVDVIAGLRPPLDADRSVQVTMWAAPTAGSAPGVIGLLHAVARGPDRNGRDPRGAPGAAVRAVCVTRADGVVERVNPAYVRLTGAPADVVVGRPITAFDAAPDPSATTRPAWTRPLDTAETWSGRRARVRPDGTVYLEACTVSPLSGANGGIDHLVFHSEDITASLIDEQALLASQRDWVEQHERLEETVSARTADLAASEARLRLILESSADGLYGLDIDGKLTFLNPAACAMLGTTGEAAVGRSVLEVIRPLSPERVPFDAESCPQLAALRGSIPVRRVGDYYSRSEGSIFPVSYAVQPMIQEGHTVGAVVSFTDITAQERAESARGAALREAERLAQARSEFVANMSHEIRTPLNAVLGLAQIGERTAVGRRTRETFHRIVDAGQHLLGVIDDILDFSKIEAGKIIIEHEEVELGAAIDRAVGLTASRAWSKGLQFLVDEAPDLPERINGDMLRLSQVLINLLSNAVKFTVRGHVALEVARDGEMLRFRVEDTGIGMTHEQLGRMARPFQQADSSTTRRFGGTGLGLAITQQLVASMGGTVSVASEPDMGTVFEVRLPIPIVQEARPAEGRVALLAANPADARRVTNALVPRGIEVLELGPREPVPPDALVLVQAESLQVRAVMNSAVAALERGQPVAVCVRTGETAAPYAIRDRVVELEEPLRARHVIAARSAARRAAGADGDSRRLSGYTILAAEDNEINRLVLDELLGAEGARVVCVENGRRAVERVHDDGPDAYDLVLADVQMPDMDGYQATRRIHELRPSLPVVALTAHATSEERARCLEAGMVEHVAKPFDIDNLVSLILRLVPGKARPEAPPAPPAAPEPVDWAALDARFRMRTGFIIQLLSTMLTSHLTTVRDLRDAAGNVDLERLAFLTHSVKGMAGNLGAMSLHALAGEAEARARARDPAACAKAFAVAEALATLLEATERRVHQLQATMSG